MSDEPELKSRPVTYDVDDLVALSRLVPRSNVHLLRIAAGAIVILLFVTIIAEAWALTGYIDWPALVATLFVASLILVISSRRFRARMFLKIVQRSPLHSANAYEIRPDALRINSAKGVSDIRWNAFPRVECAEERLFLFMSKRQAFIVPRRAFDSDEEFDAFAAAAQARWREAERP